MAGDVLFNFFSGGEMSAAILSQVIVIFVGGGSPTFNLGVLRSAIHSLSQNTIPLPISFLASLFPG